MLYEKKTVGMQIYPWRIKQNIWWNSVCLDYRRKQRIHVPQRLFQMVINMTTCVPFMYKCMSATAFLHLHIGIRQVQQEQYGMNQLAGTPCSGSTMDEDDSSDWLHMNATYQRQPRDVEHIANMPGTAGMQGQENITPTSYIYGPSVEKRGIRKLT